MSKLWTVMSTEILKHLRKPSFWLTLFLVPVIFVVISLVNGGMDEESPGGIDLQAQILDQLEDGLLVGVVDQSGLVPTLPPTLPADVAALYQLFPNDGEARAALSAGQIDGYYVIPADYLATGVVTHYSEQFNPFGGSVQERLIKLLLTTVLIEDQDIQVASALLAPTAALQTQVVGGEAATTIQTKEREIAASQLGFMFTMLLYISIFASASLLLQSLIEEKENRVIEIVLSSTEPRTLLLGKTLGLGLLGLLQMAVWLGTGYATMSRTSEQGAIFAAIDVSAGVWVLALVCFVLGFLIYASLMAGIGAVVNTMRESSQLTMVVSLPLIIPLILMSVISVQPNGILAQVLSLVPLTAPIVLVVRAALADLSVVSIGIALALMAATVVGLQWLAARMFRATNLLAGEKPTVGALWRAMRG